MKKKKQTKKQTKKQNKAGKVISPQEHLENFSSEFADMYMDNSVVRFMYNQYSDIKKKNDEQFLKEKLTKKQKKKIKKRKKRLTVVRCKLLTEIEKYLIDPDNWVCQLTMTSFDDFMRKD